MTDTEDNVDELSVDSNAEEVEEEEEEIYDSATFLSGPRLSEGGTLPEDILTFDFSYGFTVRKLFNLSMPDPDYLLFTAGNIIHIFHVPESRITFRRSALGGGIGNIRTNPNPEYKHVAIAENGNKFGAKPLVVIYEWPSLDIICGLKGGSTAFFTNLDYSPDGMLLVSQAGEPDYLITIYDWPRHTILLRSKSYINDVNRVKFSETVPGQLCTAGVAHIKFWKMCNTFTGLKLKGEVGRFGKTEYTDIIGVVPMPDEKVISGCKWGNLLVWEGGLIKVEVMRNNRKPLHEEQIVQIFYIEGELWTVSQDGHIKVWWYEKIDQADPPEDDKVVMLEPSYDFYTPGVMLMSVIKRYRNDQDSYHYFAQDGNGGIWLLDCNVYETPEQGKRLIKAHAGAAVDLAVAPFGNFFITLGIGGYFFVYDYIKREIIYEHKFPAKGQCIYWLSMLLIHSGDEIIMGFDDGNLRICLLNLNNPDDIQLKIIQIIKPHSAAVSAISVDPNNSILVSGGEDSTIFVFKIQLQQECAFLVPIGFVPCPDIPSCIIWKPHVYYTVTVGCKQGFFLEVELPAEPQFYTTVSYLLKVKPKCRRFMSYKSQIRRNIEIAIIEEKKAQKVEKKRKEMEKIKEENPGLEIDEEAFLADSDSSIKWDPLYIPETPGDILWLQYTPEDTLWISMSGYDAGYIYEYQIDQPEDVPLRFKMIDDADDTEISSYLYNYNKKYLIFAMQDGTIRVNKVNPMDFRDLSDYWTLAMHENLNGFVPKMAFSNDERFFFTCGQDANVFAYTFHPENDDYVPEGFTQESKERSKEPSDITDAKAYDLLSLEQAMIKAENDRIERVANENKKKYREKIAILRERYTAILVRNDALPDSQKISRDHLEIDPRVTEAMHIMMERKVALVRRKLAFDLTKADVLLKKLNTFYLNRVDYFPVTICGLVKDTKISCLRQKRLPPALFNMHAFIDMRILEADLKGRTIERATAAVKAKVARKKKVKELEYFLLTLSQSTLELKLDPKFTRLLNKYRTRKSKWESRQEQWEDFMTLQPIEGQNHPDDVAALAYAEKNIGDLKLKTSPDYKVVNPQERETTLKKYRQILMSRRKQYNIRHKFSKKVYNLRDRKEDVRQLLLKYEKKLARIHEEIPLVARKNGPQIPSQKESEYPEKQFQIILEDEEAELAEEHYIYIPQDYIQKFVEEPDEDKAEREIILGLESDLTMDDFFQDISFLQRSKAVCECSIYELLELSREEFTPWEMEIRAFRLNRMIFEQEELIQKMVDSLEDFDDRLENLNNERAEALVDGFFCDLLIHKLHQELIILRDFEAHEEVLQEKVNSRMTNVLDMDDLIHDTKAQIEMENVSIEKNLEQQGLIQEQFNKLIHDNKFSDFLRRVFKKKYKPPKVKHADDSSSESSSSSSSESDEEDDAKSIDSRDFGFIKQDLNVCPKGCDQEIFDNTIALRSERHQLEIGVKEHQRQIEGLKKDLELNMKKLKIMNSTLQTCQEELTSYQREKQDKLNNVECTIMLNLDQIQHITEPGKTCPISECLVLSKLTLSKLYKRVGDLQSETLKLKSRHLINVKHLARMKTDLKYMHTKILEMKQRIIELIQLKFGKVLNMEVINEHLEKKTFADDIVNELMEALLRKMVHDLRLSLIDVKSLYKDELRLWDKKLDNAETDLTEALKDNTARLELLGLLKKEKQELFSQIEAQDKNREIVQKRKTTAVEIKTELNQLLSVLKDQQAQIDEMRKEIKSLKSKTRYHPVSKISEDKTDIVKKEVYDEHAGEYFYPEMIGEDGLDMQADDISKTSTPELKNIDIVRSVVKDIFDNLDAECDKISLEGFIKETIMPMIDYATIQEIVNEIVNKIGFHPSEDQLEEMTSSTELLKANLEYAESDYLFTKREKKITAPNTANMSSSEIRLYVGLVLDDILKDMMSQTEEFKYHISLCNVMMRAIEEIPIEILKKQEAADTISSKLSSCSCFSKDSIDKVKMAEVIQVWEECLCGSKDSIDKVELGKVDINWDDKYAPFRRIVDELLNRVFATGLDIITFHR
ncbi:hypothetical protein WA026_006367 [Henosepilachna vigintioctopunctata]|uniref:Cilia- and flagella-associated protein 44 n=1 Tax=Henosepilachna vigintioctopunctata TaxID=420089 RepID=A0AAW1TK00_9CUCU